MLLLHFLICANCFISDRSQSLGDLLNPNEVYYASINIRSLSFSSSLAHITLCIACPIKVCTAFIVEVYEVHFMLYSIGQPEQ